MQTIFREIKSKIIFKKRINPNFPAHVHDDIELTYTKHGRGTAYCDGKKYTLTDGKWFLAFPNQVHHYADCADGEYWVLIMKPFDLLRYGQIFMKGVPDSAVYRFENGQDDGVGFLLETACREYDRDGYSDVIYTVTEVAGMSGFLTIRTFNRAFLKKYGISPSAYRKQQSE